MAKPQSGFAYCAQTTSNKTRLSITHLSDIGFRQETYTSSLLNKWRISKASKVLNCYLINHSNLVVNYSLRAKQKNVRTVLRVRKALQIKSKSIKYKIQYKILFLYVHIFFWKQHFLYIQSLFWNSYTPNWRNVVVRSP